MGYGDLSSFGHPSIYTPTIDRFVYEGKKLTNHYTCPMCTPTRGALLTGRLPIRNGLYNGIGWPKHYNHKFASNVEYDYNNTLIKNNIIEKEYLNLFKSPPISKCQDSSDYICDPLTKVFYPGSTTGLSPDEITIAEVLKDIGYTSGIIGKWHLGVGSQKHNYKQYLPLQQGFDTFWGVPYSNDMGCPPGIDEPCIPTAGTVEGWTPVPIYSNNDIIEQPTNITTFIPRLTEKSIQFIKDAHNNNKPFFLIYATVMPHVPIFTSNKFKGISKRGKYGDAIQELDASINDILQVIKELGIDENTMSIFMSDNGPFPAAKQHGGSTGLFSGGKGTTWEGGIRSPTIIRWPSMITPNSISNGISSVWDIFTTIICIAGGKLPSDIPIDGLDLSPLLFNDSDISIRECINLYSQKYLMATRCGDYKIHWRTRDALSAPIIQNPPLIYNIEIDPSELYPLSIEDNKNILQKAIDFRIEFESSFEPGESLFEYYNEDYQPCCCLQLNCTCKQGYSCKTDLPLQIYNKE